MRQTSIMIIAIIMLLFISIPVFAAGPALRLGPAVVSGSTVSFSLALTNVPGTPISAVALDIVFNPRVFAPIKDTYGTKLKSAIAGTAMTAAGKQINQSSPAPGVLRLVGFGLGKTSIPDGTIAQISFTIKEGAMPYHETFTIKPTATDPDGNEIAMVGSNTSAIRECPPNHVPAVALFKVQSVWNRRAVPVSMAAVDDGIPVSYLITESSLKPTASANWSDSVPTTYALQNSVAGLKTLYAWVKDSVGNVSAAKSAKFTVDLTPPVLTVNAVGITSKSSVTVTGTKEAGSHIEAKAPNGVSCTFSEVTTDAATKWACAVVGYSQGTTSLSFIATDKAGNSTTKTADIIYDATKPTGTISIAGTDTIDGHSYTNKTSVVLTLVASDKLAVSKMQFSTNGTTWTAWEPFKASKTFAIGSTAGPRAVSVRFMDVAGNIGDPVSAGIIYDGTKPTGTISIVGTDALNKSTNSPTVTLAISAIDANTVSKMQISESSSFTGAVWEQYTTSRQYTFANALNAASPADGTKNVYVRFMDVAGNVSVSYKKSIILDRAKPAGTVKINGGAIATASSTVILTLSATGATQMQLSLDGGISWSDWAAYAKSKSILLPGAGQQTVQVRFRDAAGNVSNVASATTTVTLKN